MKKKHLGLWITGIIGMAMLVAGSVLAMKTITNHNFVKAYSKEDYSTEDEEKLLVMNTTEAYVPYYNLGDAAYKNGDYSAAVLYFTEALGCNPPEEKEALIRINLALAMCHTIDFENIDSEEKRDAAVATLEAAKAVLLEKGFATDSGDGKSENAQKLKDDIDRMIERLKESGQGDGSGEESSDNNESEENSDNNGEGSKDKEARVQEELEKNRKEALKEASEMQESMEKWSEYLNEDGESDSEYDFEQKRW